MCHIFAGQDPQSYTYETRSIRLNGQSTSVRLERTFWQVLEEIASEQGFTVPKFISTLHTEILELRGEAPNFTSHLRCICMVYIDQMKLRPQSEDTPLVASDTPEPGLRPL